MVILIIVAALTCALAIEAAAAVPVISINRILLDISNDDQPLFTGVATADSSTISTVECRIDGGAWAPASSLSGANPAKEAFKFLPLEPMLRLTTPHTIEARCRDAAGNMSDTFLYNFYIVGDKPEITVTANGLNMISGDPIDFTPSFEVRVVSNKGLTTKPLLAVLKNGTTVSTEVLVKTFVTGNTVLTSSYNPTLADGTYILDITIADDAGNLSTREVGGLVVQYKQTISIQGNPLSFPNPYPGSGNLNIGYALSKDSTVTLAIYDLTGTMLMKKVFPEASNGAKTGYNEIVLNGQTDGIGSYGNGIYVFFLTAEGRIIGRGKIVVIRR